MLLHTSSKYSYLANDAHCKTTTFRYNQEELTNKTLTKWTRAMLIWRWSIYLGLRRGSIREPKERRHIMRQWAGCNGFGRAIVVVHSRTSTHIRRKRTN